jgi:hypothetical protein
MTGVRLRVLAVKFVLVWRGRIGVQEEGHMEEELLALLDVHLKSIWAGDLQTYRATTAEDVTFYEWYISSQRIDGLDLGGEPKASM